MEAMRFAAPALERWVWPFLQTEYYQSCATHEHMSNKNLCKIERSPPMGEPSPCPAAVLPPSRCHHCTAPLSEDMETSAWTVAPFIRDSFSMIGSAVGGTASAFYGFNHAMPFVRRWVKGPMWVHFLVGAPPVIVFSSACAGLAGGAMPALAQLASSSCHAAFSSSTFGSPSQDDKMHKSRSSSPL